MGDNDATVEEEQPLPGQVRRRGFLRPSLALLDGEPTQTADLVAAGRILARIMVDQDRPVIVCGDGAWAGVWDLERLTDTEAVTWGLWVAMKVRRQTRHTWASLALAAGVPAKVVQEILGHSSVGITLDTYSHLVPAMREDAAATVAALILGGSR